MKNSLLLVSICLVVIGIGFIILWPNMTASMSRADLEAILETTTATFGTMLGIITAGLMFTQAKFSELASELSDKSSDYLAKVLSLEKIQ